MTELVPWSHEVGLLPHRVVAYEDFARKGVVYLRWRVEKVGKARKDGRRDATEWTRKSLGFTLGRDRRGKVLREDAERAVQEAERQYHTLVTGGQLAPVAKAELTIAEGWKRATDPETGRWPADTMHRREMARSIDAAKSILGPRTTWNSIGKPELRDKQYAWAEAAEVRAKLRHEVAVSTDEQHRISGAIRSKRQTALPKQSRRRSSN